MKLRVKIKRVKDVKLPKYAKPGDSGFDLVAAEDTVIWPGEKKLFKLDWLLRFHQDMNCRCARVAV